MTFAAEPKAPKTCHDETTAPSIDVAAFSVGKPDGVYYAGKRLYEVTAEDLDEYRQAWLWGSPHGERRAARMRELGLKIAGSTMVVRWEIQNGVPGAPEPIANRLCDGSPQEYRRFDWGPHGCWTSLHHAICTDVDRSRQSNDYIDAFDQAWKGLADEWVMSRVGVREHMAREDVRRLVVYVLKNEDLTTYQVHTEVEAVLAEWRRKR